MAAAERLTGLRDTVPVGSVLTMHAGSAAQVLLAWEDPDRIHAGLRDSTFTPPRWPACGGAAGRRASPSVSRGSPR